eukprot:GHVS01082616.1.p1 GENE.GHVS01082616.1~~GHVS01082616.1.p1  ORF type:complete len:501 (+),score=69.09 GHVS01082616.1:196-1698(+)
MTTSDRRAGREHVVFIGIALCILGLVAVAAHTGSALSATSDLLSADTGIQGSTITASAGNKESICSRVNPTPPKDGSSGSRGNRKDNDFLGVEFDTGFVDVGRGKMFYWYFPYNNTETVTPAQQRPTVMWLTGGPGCASEIAVFEENGPFWVNDDATLRLNQHSWTQRADILYVDQPLGTGFSVANNPHDFVHNETQMAEDMAIFLEGFLKKYPTHKNKPFYITGESYAGHYIPALAHYLKFERSVANLNLQGLAIGNGWVDPYLQYPPTADFARDNGLLDERGYEVAKKGYAVCDGLIAHKMWPLAYAECNKVSNKILGDRNPYDIRLMCEVPPLCYNTTSTDVFLNKPSVQERLGVHHKWKDCDRVVYLFLIADWITDMREKIQDVLNANMRVLVYSGDKDFICNWYGGYQWVNAVNWKHGDDFKRTLLKPWTPAGSKTPAGQVKRVSNFTFLRIYDAGHMVPMDKPQEALEMFSEFLTNNLEMTNLRYSGHPHEDDM